MAYEKQNFQDDEVLSADQLNHIEQGIADTKKSVEALKEAIPDNMKTENWVFTLEDGTVLTKAVFLA